MESAPPGGHRRRSRAGRRRLFGHLPVTARRPPARRETSRASLAIWHHLTKPPVAMRRASGVGDDTSRGILMKATRRRPAASLINPRRRALIARRAVMIEAPARSQRQLIQPRAAAAQWMVVAVSARRSRRRVLTHLYRRGRLATTERRPALVISRAAPRRCARRIWCHVSNRRTRRRPSSRPRGPFPFLVGRRRRLADSRDHWSRPSFSNLPSIFPRRRPRRKRSRLFCAAASLAPRSKFPIAGEERATFLTGAWWRGPAKLACSTPRPARTVLIKARRRPLLESKPRPRRAAAPRPPPRPTTFVEGAPMIGPAAVYPQPPRGAAPTAGAS
mmetsp:Transcript_13039/g.37980  ORF Transcript_13039/g.37980 Transcript_13039/m.37980 type:complete len:332 (-) Transcript_13039:431-1426(-)